MIPIPTLNDIINLHLTLADWESLQFTHVAVDALNLFIRSHILIPESAHVVFFDTRIRAYHKISRAHILSSPFDGQKIAVTPEKLSLLFQTFSEKYPDKQWIWIDSASEQPLILDNQDANIVYQSSDSCHCYACEHFTPEYLAHLEYVGVPLEKRLKVLHNLAIIQNTNKPPTTSP